MKIKHAGFIAGSILLVTGAPVARAGEWVIENASKLMWFESMRPDHLAIDLNGRPCAAFGGDQLYYSHFNGAIWEVETVDGARGVGAYASLELSGGRYPRIAYSDGANDDLKYAAWEHDGGDWHWNIEQVDSLGQVGASCSLALGSDGNPHIAYFRFGTGLMYIRKDAGGWTTPVAVDPPGSPSTGSSLVLDSDNEPHIASLVSTGILRYSHHDATGWHTSTLSSQMAVTTVPCMTIANNFLNCVFVETGSGGDPARIRYVSFAPGFPGVFLTDETVTTVPSASSASVSTATLPTGQPHVAYTLSGNENVFHAVRTGPANWTVTPLPAGSGTTPSRVSIALNAFDRPFIHYLAERGILTMTSRERLSASNWAAPVGYVYGYDASEHADLAVLGDGTPVIAYRNQQLQGLLFRQRIDFGWVSYGDSDLVGDCGEWVSIAAAQEHPRELHAAYYVGATGDLRYQRSHGYPVDGPWTPDSGGNVGSHASLAVSPTTGAPTIAYFDASNGYLKYASRILLPGGGTSWVPQTIDPTPVAGEHAALAYDSTGHPYVAYRRTGAGIGEVRVVDRLGAGWSAPQVVLSFAGLDPEHIAIAIDSNDQPHLSLIDASDGQLYYGWKSGGNWTWQAVTGQTSATGHTSIMLDVLDQPLIMFIHEPELRVARRKVDGVSWVTDRVTPVESSIGAAYGSRAIRLVSGPNGRPMVCYYDAIERDVMFAWKQEPHIISIEEIAADSYQLDWTGEGTGVWIDRSPDLSPGSWTPAAGPLQGSFHTIGETAGRMFYRLRAE